MFTRARLHREAERPFPAAAEASTAARVYPWCVNRPINVALGWPLPSWLLDYGPIVFIVLEGTVAIALHGHGVERDSRLVLALGLIVTAAALVWRHRAPVLALAATGGDEDQRSSLTQLAGLGREALSEMHRMLGVLRLDDGAADAEREPQPGVRDIQRLIDRAGSAGISAELVVDGDPRPLPPAVDLSAYRIVQEALTNVIRHAAAGSVTVALKYSPSDLEVTVVDDGVGSTANGDGGGHGLVGMRERVALFGGELSAGPVGADGHGYRVHAALPVG